MSLQTRMKTMALNRAKEKVAADVAADSCSRRSRRKETALPGMLTFSNMSLSIPCTIADMSGSGAKLAFLAATVKQFGDMEHLPARCTLILRADRMFIDSQIMWRRSGKIGVKFLSPPMPMAAVSKRK